MMHREAQKEEFTMKSTRNKTIDLSTEAGAEYLHRCISIVEPATRETVLDRTILGDAFAVLGNLPRGVADLVIVDPPYNLDRDFHGNAFSKMSDAQYAAYTERWLEQVRPLLKETGSIYVCCDWQSSSMMAMALKRHFIVRNRITWQREKGRGSKHNWKNAMEDIWFATCSDDYTFHVEDVMQRRRVVASYRVDGAPKDWEETADGNYRNTYPSNFWDDISIPYWSMPENTAHPTQKPEKLMAKLILASSSPGDVVLDPFAGSGSTAVTAKKLGRHYISVEQNPQYCVWTELRLERAETDSAIQGYVDGVFWERNTAAQQKKHR